MTAPSTAVLTMIGPQMFGRTWLKIMRARPIPNTSADDMNTSRRTACAAALVTRVMLGEHRTPSAIMPRCELLLLMP
jgi:hypothetical protein